MEKISRRDFGISAFALTAATFGFGKLHVLGEDMPQHYPIEPDILTTTDRTILPGPAPSTEVELFELAKYDEFGIGNWTYGDAVAPVVRTDIMPAGFDASSVDQKRRLLKFFTISDIHITDKEAPNQGIYLQQLHPDVPVSTSAYSGVMLYSTQVLDAAIQTVNVLHRTQPFDFGLSLGDACNSTQFNELRWYIDVLDGKTITPSSGAHLGAESIDYQKSFKAVGLDKSIPWYQVLGNHDHFWLGSFPVDYSLRPDLRGSYVSDEVFAAGDVLAGPAGLADRKFYMGVLDGSTPYGDIKFVGDVKDFTSPPKVVADPDRRSLRRTEWMAEFFNTSSDPIGHGFDPADAKAGFACFSFVPKSDVPIKVISLDDTQTDEGKASDFCGHGFLDMERWTWLKKELADGDAAGQLMIIAAHIPIGVEETAPRSQMGWWMDPRNAVTLPELIDELHSHPNLLMWLAGHRHLNTVKAFLSPDPDNAPEKGFWHVETCSLRDFPQQFRTFDIFVNSDQTISIETINVDPSVKHGTPAAMSRKYAVAAQQLVKADIRNRNPTKDPTIAPMPTGSYNARLVKKLSPAMSAKLQALFPAV